MINLRTLHTIGIIILISTALFARTFDSTPFSPEDRFARHIAELEAGFMSRMPDEMADPTGYAEWKTEFADALSGVYHSRLEDDPRERPTAPMVLALNNGFVDFQMSEGPSGPGVYSEGCRPDGTGTWKKLTYYYPSTPWDWTIYKIDGFTPIKTYRDGTGTTLASNADSTYILGNKAYTVWNNLGGRGCKVVQILECVSLGSTPGENEQVKRTNYIIPRDGSCHNVGCMVFYDTMLDTDDAAAIATSYGYTGVSSIHYAPDIPPLWRAYQGGYPPSGGSITALGILIGFEAVMPDVFWYGQWGSGTGNGWDDAQWAALTGGTFGDSATMVKWYQRNVCPGDTAVFTTYYGIGEIIAGTGLRINHTPPRFSPGCSDISPNPFDIEAYVTNIGTSTATNVQVTLDLSGSSLSLVSGANPQNLGAIAGYGGGSMASWRVSIPTSAYGTTQCYTITATWTGGGPETQSYCISVPEVVGFGAFASPTSAEICYGDCVNLQAWPDSIPSDYSCGAWSSDFEATGEMTHYGTSDDWAWGTPTSGPGSARSGTRCWATNLSGNYRNSQQASLVTPGVDLSACANAQFSFWHWYNTNVGALDADGCQVFIGRNPTGPWTQLAMPGYDGMLLAGPMSFEQSYNGSSGSWRYQTLDISSWIGGMVYIRFYFASGWTGNSSGWYIDDVSIEGSGTAGPGIVYNYSWTPTAGLSDPTSPNPIACPTTTTTYTATITALDDCIADASVTVVVNPDPVVTIADIDICDGETGTLVASVSPSGTYTYSWSPGGYTTASIDVSPTATTAYTCYVRSTAGCEGSGYGTVNVHPNPIVTIEDAHVCLGVEAVLTAVLSPDIPGATFHWEPGGLTDNPIRVYPSDTTTYTCVVTTPYGCEGEDSATVFIEFPPPPPILISPADRSHSHVPYDPIDFIWHASPASPPITYDLVVDGITVVSDTRDTFWTGGDFPCGESHSWFVIVHGNCGTDTSEIWSFDMAPCDPPIVEIIEPLDGTWSACDDQGIFVLITDAYGVDVSSIRLRVNGVVYSVDGTTLEFRDDTLRFTPPALWSDGEVVFTCIDSVSNIYGVVPDDLPICWEWYLDLSAPFVWGMVPSAGSVTPETSPTVSFNIADTLSGLDESSVVITINDSVIIDLSSPEVTFDGTNISISFIDLGLAFDIGDTVEICVTAQDMPDYCPPNVLDTCWFFTVNPLGPAGTIIEPLPWTYTACDDQGIIIYLYDEDGINHPSVLINVNGVDIRGDSPSITWTGDTLIYNSPTLWTDAETVLVRLLEAEDLIGNPLGDTLHWRFIVDLTSPVIWGIDPPDAEVLADASPEISFALADWLSGLDMTSVTVSINGITHPMGIGFLGELIGDTLECLVQCIDLGLSFAHNDTVEICVHAADSPDYCPPNELDTCWTYYIDLLGPIYSDILDPASGEFLAGAVSACDDQGICIALADIEVSHGVDEASILLRVNGTDYTTTDAELTYAVDTLCFTPPSPWIHGSTVRVELISANDSLGNPLSFGASSWEFYIDLRPPRAYSLSPSPGAGIGTLTPVVGFSLTDTPAGTDLDGVLIGVDIIPASDTTWFDIAETWFGRTDSNYTASITDIPLSITGGDSVRICVRSGDMPDFCPPNLGDTCWVFYLPTGGPVGTVIEPVNGSWSACHFGQILLTVSDPDTVIGSTIILSVNGTRYTTSAVELEYRPDTLIYTPSSDWIDASTVVCSLIYAEDRFGNPNEDTLVWSFYIDFAPPAIGSILPAPSAVIADLCPTVSFSLTDLGSGITESSIDVTVNGTEHLNIYDGRVSWAGGVLSFDICDVVTLTGGSVINICVEAEDSPDYCGPNILDTCWSFSIASGGPFATILHPTDGIITSCDPQEIVMTIEDTNGVNAATILFMVNGVEFRLTDSELSWAEPVLRFNGGAGYFAHGTTVSCSLVSADDMLGNPLENPLGWSFVVDYRPPELIAVIPTPGVPVDDRSPLVSMELRDIPAGINYGSAVLNVPGYGGLSPASPAIYWIGDMLYFDPDSLGIIWSGGDSILLCLDIADLPDTIIPYCSANDTTYCWHLVIARGGPIATIIEPLDGTVSACSLQQIIITIEDPNGVDDTTIVLIVNGVEYGVGDPEIEWDEPLLTWTPPSVWVDGPVHVELVSADDLLGNELSMPLDWWFEMDLTPPTFWSMTPPHLAVIAEPSPDISVRIADAIAGLSDTCIWMTINGSTFFDLSSPEIAWDGELLTLSTSMAGLSFVGGDNINVCVHACDDPDYCPPNDSLRCWRFSITTGGPVATIIEPLDATFSACSLQQIIFTLVDSNGVDAATIAFEVNGTEYRVGDSEVSWVEPLLTWTPPAIWADGPVTVRILSADDLLGNALEGAPVEWSFTMDLTPPNFSNAQPSAGFPSYDWQLPISVEIRDDILGVEPESLEVVLDGIYRAGGPLRLRLSDSGVTWVAPLLTVDPASVDESAHGITYPAPEDTLAPGIYFPEFATISITAHAFDREPDYCEPNGSSFSWDFTVEDDDTLGPEVFEFGPPFESTQMPVFITARIVDPSDVFSAELIWDTDGEVDTDFNGPVAMDSIPGSYDAVAGGWLWRTTTSIATFTATTTVTYRIIATDNDYDFLNSSDRSSAYADSICPILGGPTAQPITPLPGQITACADQPIVIRLTDDDGVDPAPMVLEIAGVRISWPDPRLTYSAPTSELIFDPGTEIWTNEQTVTVLLTLAQDSLGNPMWDTLQYSFRVDLEPPTFANPFPSNTEMVSNNNTEISVDIGDNLAGVRESELSLAVYGNTYTTSSSALTYASGRLMFNPRSAGIEFSAGDSVSVNVFAGDDPDLCEPNRSEFSWWFVMEPMIACNIYPNPITPNNDGTNDVAVFEYPMMFSGSAELMIFDIRNQLVYSSTIGPIESYTDVSNRIWNGLDNNGIQVNPGLYLYIIQKDGNVICNGTVAVSR